jgi:hypothetical protein
MAGDRTQQNDPAAELPELSGAVHPLRPDEVKASLMSRLVPSIDKIRQVASDLGLRPYRVFMVHVLWTGDRPGDGQPVEISRREILPTPRIRDMSATTEVLSSFGRVEEGGIVVDRISAKLSEDDLLGVTPDLLDPAIARTGKRNGEFFWEVQENRPGFPRTIPRRYVPSGTPTLMRGGLHWRLPLAKQMVNRSRNQTFDRRVQ